MSIVALAVVVLAVALLTVAVTAVVRRDGYGALAPPRSHPDWDEQTLLSRRAHPV